MTEENQKFTLDDGTVFYLHDMNLTVVCNWLTTRLALVQSENKRLASEITRLKDELADLRDVQQHQPQQIIGALTHLVEQIKTPDQTVLGLEALVHKALSQSSNSNIVTGDVTAIDAPKKRKKSSNISNNSTKKNVTKHVTARVNKTKLRQYLKDHTWDEAMVTFGVSRMTISRALK